MLDDLIVNPNPVLFASGPPIISEIEEAMTDIYDSQHEKYEQDFKQKKRIRKFVKIFNLLEREQKKMNETLDESLMNVTTNIASSNRKISIP